VSTDGISIGSFSTIAAGFAAATAAE